MLLFYLRGVWEDDNKLNLLQERLIEVVHAEESSSLLSFRSFFLNGSSCKETFALRSIRNEIFTSICSSSDVIFNDRMPWNQFGTIDAESKEFEFHPESYVESLRYQLLFEEKLARTQLFTEFLDEVRKHDYTEENLIKMKNGEIISNWRHRKRTQISSQA